MIVRYQIVHVHRDGKEDLISTVGSINDVQKIVDTARYAGTWLTETRKLLRYGRGEINVRIMEIPPRIVRHRVISTGKYHAYELMIINDPKLIAIRIDDKLIVGFGPGHTKVWQTNSFTNLCNHVSKEIAYECFKYYERYLTEFNVAGAI